MFCFSAPSSGPGGPAHGCAFLGASGYTHNCLLTALLLILALPIAAAEFVVEDIEVEGLERIEAGTVFTYLPISVGDTYTDRRSAELMRALYKTGFFSDISLKRRGNVLIVDVEERPAIAEIEIKGNEDIADDDLIKALKDVGIARGRVLNRSVLERLENELRQQYFARGKYNVQIDVEVADLERNRVDIDIDIDEGEVATIKSVNVVGNEDFDDDKLLEDFESGLPSWWAFLSSRDKYSKQKLSGDLETLRTKYLDSGYLTFNIDSTQVSITPDREDIYITINIDEGDRYTVKDVKLAGTFVVPEEELRGLLDIHPGDVFSRRRVVTTTDNMNQRLGDEGYAFANVNAVPELDKENKEVALTFFVDPGQRVYVRRINFIGNSSTTDEVFRRELRQMEGAWYSTSNVELSRRRIQRLSFIEEVDIQTRRLSGISDQVDLDISLTERLAGNFSIGAGFSQNQGVLFNLSLSQENFLGTGRRVALQFDNSDVNTIYSFSYDNPFYTIDGVSRGFSLSYRQTDAREADVSDYSADQFGGNVRYGIPLTEDDSVRAGFGIENIDITTSSNTPTEIVSFTEANGDDYNIFSLNSSFIHDTRDRTVFTAEGNLQRFNLELATPGSDLQYYKADYQNNHFIPLLDKLTLAFNGRLAYGDSYSGTSDLPFFEKYFAGGIRTVRGFDANSLGPRDSKGAPFGGDFRFITNLELLFPPPFVEEARNTRLVAFVDAGNVFAEAGNFEFRDMRVSTGFGLTWITPVGALTFALARALNDKPGDELQSFQFNIGAVF